MTDEEQFYAWLDGELDGDAAAAVAARVAANPDLQRKAEQHRALNNRLRTAFDAVLKDSAPPPPIGVARVARFQSKRSARNARHTSFGLPQWAAMAATLAIGFVGGQLVGDGAAAPVESRDGMLVAAASLDKALDAQLASAGNAGSIRIGLTFRDHDGTICRSFSGAIGSGLACRKGGEWRVDEMFGSAVQGDYRMASGEDPRLVALIDERIAGEPFDATAEKLARDRSWR